MSKVIFDQQTMSQVLSQTDKPVVVVTTQQDQQTLGLFTGELSQLPNNVSAIAVLPALTAQQLGDSGFCREYQTRYAYMTGAMANGIASAELTIAMGQAGMLASYGAGGVLPQKVEQDVVRIKQALAGQPFAVNLIHAPHEQLMEQSCVDILIKHQVKVIEASAFMDLTLPLVHFRLAGLEQTPEGKVVSHNKVIAKVSRTEVAQRFMVPPPARFVEQLLQQGKITPLQAQLASQLTMADDITVEADSGGHTDRRSLVALLPMVIDQRDRLQCDVPSEQRIRIGAAGGISTPSSALAAFAMGAAYIVTGSINQSCIESGSCDYVRDLLAKADMADVEMAPAADMFEMGVQLQVLKRGTLFPMRSKKLYELYQTYAGLDDIPAATRQELEKQVFKRPLEQVWQETCEFFNQRDPGQIERAMNDPKRKMALVFRSYLGQSSMWANQGVKDRVMDYQIWAGPALGAFNDWVKDSYLAQATNRRVAEVAEHIMLGCAFSQRLHLLQLQGIVLPAATTRYALAPLSTSNEAQNAA